MAVLYALAVISDSCLRARINATADRVAGFARTSADANSASVRVMAVARGFNRGAPINDSAGSAATRCYGIGLEIDLELT